MVLDMSAVTALGGVTIGLGTMLEIAAICFAAGGIVMKISNNTTRIKKLEGEQEKLPEMLRQAIASPMDRLEAVQKERIERVEAAHADLHDRFLRAIENLGEKMGNLTTELRSVVAGHEERFRALENRD